MTETTTAANKAKPTKQATSSFPLPDYGEIRDAKIRPAEHGNAGGIS